MLSTWGQAETSKEYFQVKYTVIWHDCEDDRTGTDFEVEAPNPQEAYFKAVDTIKNFSSYLRQHFCSIDLECLIDEKGKSHHPDFFLKVYKIEIKSRAIKDLKGIDQSNAKRIAEKIKELENNLRGDVKQLTNHTPEYRLRVGSYRVLFEIEQDTIIIYRIKHRKEAYVRR